MALIKPQFEVGRDALGKGGIVRDEAEQHRVCDEISTFLEAQGWSVLGLEPSPSRAATATESSSSAPGRGNRGPHPACRPPSPIASRRAKAQVPQGLANVTMSAEPASPFSC